MTPAVKRCCIRRLESPSRKATREVKAVLEEIRQAAWVCEGHKLTLKLEGIRHLASKRLQALQQAKVINQWHFDAWQGDWEGYRIKIEYGYIGQGAYGPVKFVGVCSTLL